MESSKGLDKIVAFKGNLHCAYKTKLKFTCIRSRFVWTFHYYYEQYSEPKFKTLGLVFNPKVCSDMSRYARASCHI